MACQHFSPQTRNGGRMNQENRKLSIGLVLGLVVGMVLYRVLFD